MKEHEIELYIELQKEYERRFGEPLVFSVVGYEERSHIEVLKECLQKGRPYEYPDKPEDLEI